MRHDLKFFLQLMAVSFALFLTVCFGCSKQASKPFECRYEGRECPEYYNGCKGHKEPVNTEYFKQGQIMLPDYACPDTLIVIDAATLNKNFGYYEQCIDWGTDGDIDSHCIAQINKACLLALHSVTM